MAGHGGVAGRAGELREVRDMIDTISGDMQKQHRINSHLTQEADEIKTSSGEIRNSTQEQQTAIAEMVKSISWPTAETIGTLELWIARATISSLNAQISSKVPPPLVTMITSNPGQLFSS